MPIISLLLPLMASTEAASANVIAADAHIIHHATATTSHRKTQQKEERYEILPSAAILKRMQDLVTNYPTFATLTTTQEWFGLPRAGE